jgi:hypothetical protein
MVSGKAEISNTMSATTSFQLRVDHRRLMLVATADCIHGLLLQNIVVLRLASH